MKKVLLVVAAMAVSLFAFVGFAPTASAYPEVTCNIVVEPVNAKPGEPVTVHCSLTETGNRISSARVLTAADTTWVVTFAGQTHRGTGAGFTTVFIAPDVKTTTTYQVHAVSNNPDGKCERRANVVVSPEVTIVDAPGGGLPGTGGPQLLLLLGGLVLVSVGGVAVVRSRRHDA